jgi:hypothetical protein
MEIKVYKFGDYDWVATGKSLTDTITWYRNEFGEDTIDSDDIYECNIDKTGMWWETESVDDLRKFNQQNNDSEKKIQEFGDVKIVNGSLCRYISLRDAIKLSNLFIDEPFIIASTEF